MKKSKEVINEICLRLNSINHIFLTIPKIIFVDKKDFNDFENSITLRFHLFSHFMK